MSARPSLSTRAPQLAVQAASPVLEPEAQRLAAALSIEQLGSAAGTQGYDCVLSVQPEAEPLGYRLQAQAVGPGAAGAVWVEFARGAAAYRLRHGGGRGQALARACGLKKGTAPRIVDATAGLGRDAFVLATLGCPVTLIERSPVVALLLRDGLRRARLDETVAPIVARMNVLQGDALAILPRLAGEDAPEVVYMDPMYPQRTKSALSKKEMRLFRLLVGEDLDAARLLQQALRLATRRVTVKRPRRASPIEGPAPDTAIYSRNTRYDLYLC